MIVAVVVAIAVAVSGTGLGATIRNKISITYCDKLQIQE